MSEGYEAGNNGRLIRIFKYMAVGAMVALALDLSIFDMDFEVLEKQK